MSPRGLMVSPQFKSLVWWLRRRVPKATASRSSSRWAVVSRDAWIMESVGPTESGFGLAT